MKKTRGGGGGGLSPQGRGGTFTIPLSFSAELAEVSQGSPMGRAFAPGIVQAALSELRLGCREAQGVQTDGALNFRSQAVEGLSLLP